MIIPAAVFRIVGFIDKEKEELKNEFQEGELAFCYSEKGKPVIVKFSSNKKDATVEDYRKYLINKRNGLIKSKEIDSVAGELEYVEDISLEIESALEDYKAANPGIDRKLVMAEKKRLTQEKAQDIVYTRRTIGPGTIIRAVISIPNEGEKYKKHTFKGKEYPMIESRSIIYDNEGNPSASGFYLFSQMPNALPVTISPVFSKENDPLGFFTIKLSKLARLDHFELLVGHIKRSIDKQIIKEGKAYIPRISYDYDLIKDNEPLKNVLKDLYQFTKEKAVTVETLPDFIEKFDLLFDMVKQKPVLLTYVQIEFNLILSNKFMESALEKNSPLVALPKSIVSLNKSKENPDVKAKLSNEVLAQLKLMLAGELPCEINAIYHTPAIKLSEEPDSWGFMENNVQVDNFVLSISNTVKLI